MTKFLAGLAIGIVLGGVSVAVAQQDTFGGLELSMGDYQRLGHDSRALYLHGMADAIIVLTITSSALEVMGRSTNSVLVNLVDCMKNQSVSSTLGTMGGGVSSQQQGPSVPLNALDALIAACHAIR